MVNGRDRESPRGLSWTDISYFCEWYVLITLTTPQQDAVGGALDAISRRDPLFRIAGYAGTGKTTLSKEIIANARGAAVCAFTGKAASVLRSKGLYEATTIHKRIYKFDPLTERFNLKSRHELHDVDYFLLDEASMVNCDQWEDMQSFGKPIIAIGDPGQLEPVGDDPRLMHQADIVLTEIHRQAAESAIIQFATHVRHGGQIRRGAKGDVQIGSKELFWDSLEWADVLLCGFNKTRVEVNERRRKILFGEKSKSHKLVVGDRIVCLKNDNVLGVSNGELFEVSKIWSSQGKNWLCDLIDSEGDERTMIRVDKSAFGVAKPDVREFRSKEIMYADYGYCLSVHKFQGSEADRVAVMSEQCDLWCPIRWSYTAITRAAQELRYSI